MLLGTSVNTVSLQVMKGLHHDSGPAENSSSLKLVIPDFFFLSAHPLGVLLEGPVAHSLSDGHRRRVADQPMS